MPESHDAGLRAGVFRQELTAYPLRAVFDEAADALGDDALAALLAERGVTREELEDPLVWVSLEFVEWLLASIEARQRDAGDFVKRAGMRSISAKYIGPMYPLFVALGTPAFTYRQLPKATSRLNKLARWEAQVVGEGHVRLLWVPIPGCSQERTRGLCRIREAQLASIPTLFGVPSAHVEHTECMLDGSDSCVYDVTWSEPPSRPVVKVAALCGAAAGAALSLLVTIPWWYAGLVVAALSMSGWSLGRVLVLREQLRERTREIDEHNQALHRVMNSNDQRYAEVLEAKAEVEQKVEQRTEELRHATLQLRETLAQVQALDRAKTDFFNNVSHELRTPLTLILAPLDDLVAGQDPAGGRQSALETMQRNAVRLLRLVNQLLDLAKVDAGMMTLARVPTDVAAFVRGVVQVFESAAQRKQVRLELESVVEPVVLSLDTRWIESALTNLLANAMHFVHTGGQIRVRVIDRGAEVVIEVEDDGPGMSAADAHSVFERFAQADEGRSSRHGTGLGLAIAREAARLHGGEASVDSQLGRGSTFRLTLPRLYEAASTEATTGHAPAVVAGEQPVALLERAEAPRVEHAPGSIGEGPSLLVVEDNPDLRTFIANVLGKHFRVRTAENGVEALRRAVEEPPELIVSDVAMPEMDGFELCRRVRAERTLTATPIILLTARSETTEVLRGFDAGASDYIIKPFHARELVARVDVHVQLRRLLRDTAAQGRLAMLGLVAASVAHQVRNPLTSLASGLPAMRAKLKDIADARTLELLDIMVECAGRIERLTTDLMDVSRIDREEHVSFAPGKSLLACARLLGPRLASSEIRVHEAVDVERELTGRPGDIHHAILNLLDNASRAIDGAGQIELNGYIRDSSYVMEIGDSGSGVQPALRQQIFEPFWTNRPAGQGTGLGLAIARQIVVDHGGAIEVADSRLGGALFRLTLPLGD